jgi:hypothetical protein
MQTVKIIFGAIIGFFALITMVQMANEESGAGLAGAFLGFLIIGGLAGLLIYNGVKGNQKKNQE